MSNYLSDDELMRAAMGDLDDVPVKRTAPVTPPPVNPPKPPVDIPVVPPTPPTPPVFPPIDDDPPPEKGKKSKAKIIVPVVLALVLLAADIGAFFHFNQSAPVTNEPNDNYYEDSNNGINDNSYIDDNSYDDNSSVQSYAGSSSIDIFDVIDDVYIDVTDNKYYLRFNTSYNKTIDGCQVTYHGTDKYGTDGELLITTPDGNKINVYYSGSISNYPSTGTVSVTASKGFADVYSNIGLSPDDETREFTPIICDFATGVSSEYLNKFKDLADDYIKDNYEGLSYQGAYFGYTDDRSGNSTYGTRNFNNLVLIYTYTHNGDSYAVYVSFNNIKSGEDGFICNFKSYTKESDEVMGHIKDLFESVSDIVEDMNDSDLNYTKID